MATTIYTLHYNNLNGSQSDVLKCGDGVDVVFVSNGIKPTPLKSLV